MEKTAERMARIAPARVVRVENNLVLVEREDFRAWAAMALAYRYEAAAGDVLLVAGDDAGYYVIGVIAGTGRIVLSAHGDLELRAAGRIELRSGREVCLRGPRVRLAARTLEFFARAVTQRFTRVHQWIREALHLKAGRVHADVEGTHRVKAGRIVGRAKGDVRLDGRRIRLG